MRIGVVYPGSLESSWSESDGIASTLKAMGHDVMALPQGRPNVPDWLSRVPQLSKADLVIFSGPEIICGQNPDGFSEILQSIKAPKFALYQQAMFNPIRNYPFIQLLPAFDHHFYPAAQDAEVLERRSPGRVHHLAYGVDTTIFRRQPCPECKGEGGRKGKLVGPAGQHIGLEICKRCSGGKFDDSLRTIPLGFLGIMHGENHAPEADFARRLGSVWNLPADLMKFGNAVVQDIEDINYFMTACRVSWNLSRLMVYVNLPSLSAMVPGRAYEAAACGCCVLTPKLDGPAAKNLSTWKSGTEIGIYKNDPKELLKVIASLVQVPARAAEMGKAAAEHVAEHHSLKDRLEAVLSFYEKPKAKAPAIVVSGPVEEAKISLLHTSARENQWHVSGREWFEMAENKERVEYVLVAEQKDFSHWALTGLEKMIGFDKKKVEWNTGRPCLVDGFNQAAKASTGDILVVIADDFFPFPHWDTELLRVLHGLAKTEAVVWASTGGANDSRFIVHPILTRKYYERYGYLFNPAFQAWFADNFFNDVAHLDGVVIDAREQLHFDHRHYTEGKAEHDEVYRRQEEKNAQWRELYLQLKAAGYPRKDLRRQQ